MARALPAGRKRNQRQPRLWRATDTETFMLVLVVGPSGAGKDTLLDAAHQALADDPRFRFVRRVITRLAQAGGEAHESVTDADFATRDFALSWQAHGLHYGIPADIVADLQAGRVVVANTSRGVITQAAARFPVRVIEITAPLQILAARLSARGRESVADVTARLARNVAIPDGIHAETVLNDTTTQIGTARFLAALNRAAESARR
jgi:phosphonate metabolism protein PhnN/1,5-bisphosphokinase (PRPP-forming)